MAKKVVKEVVGGEDRASAPPPKPHAMAATLTFPSKFK
jgi:hypothetical protein